MEKVANILLVEDDHLDVLHVERTLQKFAIHHKLYIARNGREGLAKLRGTEGYEKIDPIPSIIMLDINMPKMNGLEFLTELRKDDELKDIKVFVMTTSSQETDKALSTELGVSGYIVKPLKFNNPISAADSFNLFIDLLNLKK